MSTFSIGGLSTGLDTKSIVDQLMQIDSRPKMKMEWNKALWDARKAGWGDLNGRLLSLQNFANVLLRPDAWSGGVAGASALSSDSSRVSATLSGTGQAAGTYALEVQALARGELWTSNGAALPSPTGGTRTSGQWFEATNDSLDAADRLSRLRTDTGLTMSVGAGSTITMNWTVGGTAQSATFSVATASTFQNFADWAAQQVGNGATATILPSGQLALNTAAGTANEITALSFSATTTTGAAATRFNSSVGATSTTTVAASDGGAPADTLSIQMGASTWNVAVQQGDQISDIAARINATAGVGVSAVVNGSGLLELRSTGIGAAQSFTISSTGALAGMLGFTETEAALDAQYTLDGAARTSSSNTGIQDAIPGVSLDLLAVTTAAVSITVQPPATDPAAQDQWVSDTKKKILDFVNQYNSVRDFIGSKTGEQKVRSPKNLGDYLQGPLARDVRFASVGYDLQRKVGDVVSGLPAGSAMLADIGITSSHTPGAGGSSSGKLVIDDAKLEAALRADPSQVQAIMGQVGAGAGVSADDGIARRVSEMVSQMRNGGIVDLAMQGASRQTESLQGSIERFSERLDRRRDYYDKMFSALESNVGRIQSQMGWLGGQFAQMSSQAGM